MTAENELGDYQSFPHSLSPGPDENVAKELSTIPLTNGPANFFLQYNIAGNLTAGNLLGGK